MLQQSAKWDTRHPQYRTTSQQVRMSCNNEELDNARTFLYRIQLRLQQSLEQNNAFRVILLDNLNWCTIDFNNVSLYFQSVWKQCCSSTIWGTVLKYMCIYNMVIPLVYNITFCRALGSSHWDNCPESKRCWVTIQSQRVQVELIFTYLSIYLSIYIYTYSYTSIFP